ncbi:integrase, catalytic domain protein [uncultured Prevotella sp.]|uniref:integrase, catalytic domain protein n=1 Tax=uncultured Prevotella sp. TaxID=159272 RepID=UPI002626CFD9|nr:integrase, catalytic domain protein [uncultured Prevotella sp.]
MKPRPRNIRNRMSIHVRTDEADGTLFEDWEMNLIVDKNNNAILTQTERSMSFLLMENSHM